MDVKTWLTDLSKGDSLRQYWRLFVRRERTKNHWLRALRPLRLNRMDRRHGGYIGPGALIRGVPRLQHGLHGVYISRCAEIGANCTIYQNVTIGEVDRAAPRIGEGCLIGAGAVIVGGIRIGDRVRIGAGAVVSSDVPDDCTVVAQPPRVICRG